MKRKQNAAVKAARGRAPAKALVDQAIGVLLEADDADRPAVTRHFADHCRSDGMLVLSEGLVQRLVGDADPGRAVACLAEIGIPAACALADRLRFCPEPGVLVRLVEALASVGRRLQPEDRGTFVFTLLVVWRRTEDQRARDAVLHTIGVLRRAPAPRPDAGPGQSDRRQARSRLWQIEL